jgi:hypothetical protein
MSGFFSDIGKAIAGGASAFVKGGTSAVMGGVMGAGSGNLLAAVTSPFSALSGAFGDSSDTEATSSAQGMGKLLDTAMKVAPLFA